MNSNTHLRAGELQRAFDEGFARAPEQTAENHINLLAVSIAGAPYALELKGIAGLYANKKITRIPSHAPGLLGVAGFRGAILPVYDLAALIGFPATEKPRWFAIVAGTDLAIAFETFDGHLSVPADTVVPSDSQEGNRRHFSHVLRSTDGLRAVINLSSVLLPVAGTEPRGSS